MSESIAIIKHVSFGVLDHGHVGLSFTTYTSESTAALQILTDWEEIQEVIKTAGVGDVKKLEGKPCWVEQTTSTIKFKRMWRP